jgi:isopenicillin-N N-acyltransferase-like protein
MRTLLILVCLPFCLTAQEAPKSDPAAQSLVAGALGDVLRVVAPRTPEGLPIRVKLKCVAADGTYKALVEQSFTLSYQHPMQFRLEGTLQGKHLILGSDGTNLWAQLPEAHWVVQGSNDTPRFATRPDSSQKLDLKKLLPALPTEQLALLPAVTIIKMSTAVNGSESLSLRLTPEAVTALKLPAGELQIRLDSDQRPDQVKYVSGEDSITLSIDDFQSGEKVPATEWKPQPGPQDKVEKVANTHLSRFITVALDSLGSRIPSLPPAKGERKVVAQSGAGRLEDWDGTRVLFLSGTPEAMGTQHGTLLKPEIQRVMDRVLYGVGVGSSFEKGRWFFGEIEQAQARLQPFISERYVREADALAQAAGRDREEVRLANFFPELFHCSGFALQGKATVDGLTYHGRVLDYLRGVGLEENAVVIVSKPDQGNAWVNVSYAGMLGSVTAMNEKQVAIGEMGGRGEGNWDGKPMTYLVREVMEKANTLDEAVAIMKQGPRTCEYYYVISDAKSKRSVGIKATPEIFEVIRPGEPHPQLSEAVADTVLMSAGDRYTELVKRVKSNYGKFTADTARDLMTRPVCMSSNIHSVLFCPDTLDFWVANADSTHVASEARYTKYNLKELLAK